MSWKTSPKTVSRRRRWRALVPPLALLLVGLGVLGYRVRQPDWRGLEVGVSPGGVAEGESAGQSGERKPEDAEAEVEPVEARPPGSERDLAGAGVRAEIPRVFKVKDDGGGQDGLLVHQAGMQPPIVEWPPRDGAGEDGMEAHQAGMRPVMEAQTVDVKAVWEEIEEEAKRTRREREALTAMKDRLLEEDMRESERRKQAQTERRRTMMADQNRGFREELEAVLENRGRKEAASEIRKLASLPPRRPRPGLEDLNRGPSRHETLSRSRMMRQAWVAKLRLDGQQESVILADLFEAHRLNMVARNGPKTEDEALVRAAIDLLSVPEKVHPDQIRALILEGQPERGSSSPGRPSGKTRVRGSRYGVSRRR